LKKQAPGGGIVDHREGPGVSLQNSRKRKKGRIYALSINAPESVYFLKTNYSISDIYYLKALQ
jgi:hypothetical protein